LTDYTALQQLGQLGRLNSLARVLPGLQNQSGVSLEVANGVEIQIYEKIRARIRVEIPVRAVNRNPQLS
jgi:hypothetical protein